MRKSWFFIQMDLKVLMYTYGKDITFKELIQLGVI